MNPTETDPTILTAAIASLLARHPKGFAVDAFGVLSTKERVKIANAQQLADLSRKPKSLEILLGGELIEIEVRVLSDKETDAINKLVPSPMPPPKFKTEKNVKVADGFDRQDATFVAEVEKVYDLRRAVSIDAGVPALAVQGATPEDKAAWLKETFPGNLLETLYAAVRALSTDALDRASFF